MWILQILLISLIFESFQCLRHPSHQFPRYRNVKKAREGSYDQLIESEERKDRNYFGSSEEEEEDEAFRIQKTYQQISSESNPTQDKRSMFRDSQIKFITDEINLKRDGEKEDLNIRRGVLRSRNDAFHHGRNRRRLNQKPSNRKSLRPPLEVNERRDLSDADISNQVRINQLRGKLGLSNAKCDSLSSLTQDKSDLNLRNRNTIDSSSKLRNAAHLKARAKFRFHIG